MRCVKVTWLWAVLFSFLLCGSGGAATTEGGVQGKNPVLLEAGVPAVTDNVSHVSEKMLAGLSPGERWWYNRFQEGAPLFDGWKKITQAVVEKFPEHERGGVITAMQVLGFKIGYEWSRDNQVRKVNTDMLRAWGKDLRKAGAENHIQLAQVLYKIDNEMNSLMRLE